MKSDTKIETGADSSAPVLDDDAAAGAEAARQEEYEELVAAGISEAEARELVWPDAPAAPAPDAPPDEPPAEIPPAADPSSEEPKSEEPKSEEPKSEEPKSEEPKSETPDVPPVPAAEARPGSTRMTAPKGVSSCSFGGEQYDVGEDGFAHVPAAAVPSLLEHGFISTPEAGQ